MTRCHLIITFILCCLPQYLFAQINNQDSVRITGVVFEQDSLNVLPYSRFNLNAKNFSSDEKGQFSFWAQQGEIVQFSHIGFKDTYIQVNDSLKHNNYMLGVFLTRDTVLISEVIVMPRYENLSLKAKTMPLIITPEQAYATNNVRSSTYQALTQTPLRMDAEMNHRMVLQERTWSTVYKTQIPPGKTVGVTSDNMALMRLFVPPNEQKVKAVSVQPLNRNELDLILRIYEQQHNQVTEEP
ncbi:hypothetical protein J1N10_14435 [Carboxylicivirga sp. A043]|uniref:hypothetical protein n=1 Tax=Carboxylicivirga litoralis TaxID=2816963 RepID=UPI0021CB0801|nr:hypothetical protein [Carboxylicivirga sp. A043]MCU4157181.1 hypothetical protein [Carboxylicivirga sp. A043]